MFNLESTLEYQLQPLIAFVRFVGADYRSTLSIVLSSFRNNVFMQISRVMLRWLISFILISWLACFLAAKLAISDELQADKLLSPNFGIALFSTGIVLIVFLTITCFMLMFALHFLFRLTQGFIARRRMHLKTSRLQFNRDEWIGIIPGLLPDEPIYRSMLASAPLAHHERQAIIDPEIERQKAEVRHIIEQSRIFKCNICEKVGKLISSAGEAIVIIIIMAILLSPGLSSCVHGFANGLTPISEENKSIDQTLINDRQRVVDEKVYQLNDGLGAADRDELYRLKEGQREVSRGWYWLGYSVGKWWRRSNKNHTDWK